MPASAVLKRIIKQRSTQLAIRRVQSAMRDLWSDVSNEVRHGRELQTYCEGRPDIALNLGCGDLVRAGWINVDLQPRPGVFYLNAINHLPIESGTVARIHAEHFLEHLDYEDALNFLRECHRVLGPGGIMRIVVPDGEKYMRAYADNDTEFFDQFKQLGGASEPLPTNGAICNQMFHMGGHHRFAWDFDTLQFAGQLAGFTEIKRSYHNDRSLQECIDGQEWWRPLESLYANLKR
jgi:predicted SAM-dependent methyltransferase